MTNLDSILKSKDITLSTKARLVKAIVFPVHGGHKETDMTEATEHACTQDVTRCHDLSFLTVEF